MPPLPSWAAPAAAETVDAADVQARYAALIRSILQPGEVEVVVLGSPQVTGWEHEPRQRSVEIVCYLAVHEGAVTGEKLRDRVFPPGFKPTSLRQAVSRTRTALGRSAAGYQHILPAFAAGSYELGPAVRSDYRRFQALVAAARRAPQDCEIKLLRTALGLVRAQPFSNCPPGGYGWASAEGISYAFERMITDAAQRLCELALEADDARLAEWSARQGQRAVPGHEGLYRDLALAKLHQGDVDGFMSVRREAEASAATFDPLTVCSPRPRSSSPGPWPATTTCARPPTTATRARGFPAPGGHATSSAPSRCSVRRRWVRTARTSRPVNRARLAVSHPNTVVASTVCAAVTLMCPPRVVDHQPGHALVGAVRRVQRGGRVHSVVPQRGLPVPLPPVAANSRPQPVPQPRPQHRRRPRRPRRQRRPDELGHRGRRLPVQLHPRPPRPPPHVAGEPGRRRRHHRDQRLERGPCRHGIAARRQRQQPAQHAVGRHRVVAAPARLDRRARPGPGPTPIHGDADHPAGSDRGRPVGVRPRTRNA